MTNELLLRSALAHAEAMAKGAYSSAELTRAYLLRIKERESTVGAYLTVCEEQAMAQAQASDSRRAHGSLLSPLDGIPVALKDNISTEGVRTTCASRMLAQYIPPFSATAAVRLLEAGAVMLGKTNMDEFGMGDTTTRSALGVTRHPQAPERVAGGSSGGSAAAVADGECAAALGSDTGGSIRQPASYCGVVGLRPTYGRVSRYGLVAFASSMDQIGPLTRTVADNAALFSVIAGHDERDAKTLSSPLSDPSALLGMSLHGLRIGVFGADEGTASDVQATLLSAIHTLEKRGASVTALTPPSLSQATGAYYVLSCAEASSNLSRFDGVRFGRRAEDCESITDLYCRSRSEGFGDEVKKRILLGTLVLSTHDKNNYYAHARQAAERVKAALLEQLAAYDLLLLPTAPTAAPLRSTAQGLSHAARYAADRYTVPAALAGLPALSVPFGKSKDGLPIGVQLMGKPLSEALLYGVGSVLEKEGSEQA